MGQREEAPARPAPKEDSGEELWLRLAKIHISSSKQKKPDFRVKDQKGK